MTKHSGFVLYEGPSMIDGAPIVAIAITGSDNVKTGNMVQTFIMRSDVEPHTALKTGQDASVCGDCKHRPANGGACYVTVFQAPLSVYRAYKRGRYPHQSQEAQEACAGRMVRLGTYGDPAAVPRAIWEALIRLAKGHTGYTHQWRSGDALRHLVMASADTAEERQDAIAAGWRTFRIRTESEAVEQGEFVCPASAEGGMKRTCATCGACNGAQRANQASPVIIVHGAVSKVRAFAAARQVQ